MPGVLRIFASRAPSVMRGCTVAQRANLYTRPAKGKVGTFETAVGMGMLSLFILGPSGWILAHLEDYKKRE